MQSHLTVLSPKKPMITNLRNLARNVSRKNILSLYWIALADVALTASIIALIVLIFN